MFGFRQALVWAQAPHPSAHGCPVTWGEVTQLCKPQVPCHYSGDDGDPCLRETARAKCLATEVTLTAALAAIVFMAMATGDRPDSTYQVPGLRGLQPGAVPLPGGLLLPTMSDGPFHQVLGASHAAAPSTQHLPHALLSPDFLGWLVCLECA